MSTPIPTPPAVPFLGHAVSIDRELPLQSFCLLSKQYGEIYQLNLVGTKVVYISTQELLHEVCDDKRFRKTINPNLAEVRNGVADGLFTAHIEEPNWHIAHRILMPAFSTMNVRSMFDDMVDVISQLVLKWERFGPGRKIDPAQDFTALTLEAISLCAMSYRMNTFYMEGLHPFAEAMSDFLKESGARALRPSFAKPFMRAANTRYEEDIKRLSKYVDDILEDRKANPTDKKDVLNLMLTGVDKETGQKLSDDNIKHNLLTFLIAGHETTSGMLTFVMYYLLKNPEAMRKLREEVDTRVGDRPITIDDVHKLPYLIAVMRESLRLGPPATIRTTSPYEDTIIGGGKYALEKGVRVMCNIYMVHRDTKVWDEDAEEFRPERMLDGKFEAMPPESWQPFGFGMRGCIGRPFAWQEAQITLVYLMQRFTFVMDDPSYNLHLKQTLTIKPHEFYIHAIPRTDKKTIVPVSVPSSTLLRARDGAPDAAPHNDTSERDKKPIYVLYGSNTGTSESFAQQIASRSYKHGFRASIGTLDSAAGKLPTDGPVVIVTASYEGEPADNAAHFVEWFKALQGDVLKQATFAVFGCGNHDWALTYQKIPTLVDSTLAERGARRVLPRGAGDAGSSNLFEAFDKWETELWEELQKVVVTTVDAGTTRANILRQPDATLGTVVQNKVLTDPAVPVKRHIEFQLPEGVTYRTGDYLAVLPINPQRDVRRVLAYFGLLAEQEVTINTDGPSCFPTDRPISVSTLLSGYVELSQPATTRDIKTLMETSNSEAATLILNDLLTDYTKRVLARRLSVLDILEDHHDTHIEFGAFLRLLPSMRVRQYSISSSQLVNPQCATLTISVLDAPAISGRSEPFLGVASTHLSNLRPNDRVQLSVRPSNAAFHPPGDPSIPLIMFCAGSGLAPMRGFLQERAVQKRAGREVATSLLFFGCRSPSHDYLYSDSDLKEWAELGVVDVRPAFSRASEDSVECKYVQDRLWHDRADIVKAWRLGAKMFLCGSSKMANGVKERLVGLVQEVSKLDGEAAKERFNTIVNGRFATDVFE
ncbi:hypothetical protein PHLGIDRAFT_32544 [Phlebiopsis gigantea 11061_1 CR5-6]|uniref:Uncharacterized protein n=1 Tax=Phlebiopsis gigantea (strain 11061_1 CR5-6) TaxID=745531 RepID=A0A0C3NAA9_PHLG1|nr:hypothetical protein PHLGIDRAFT_32544 [Phlebiopsis gigantea 11061_1 CR5-6]